MDAIDRSLSRWRRSVQCQAGSVPIKGNAILEIENSQTPALVAEMLTLVVP